MAASRSRSTASGHSFSGTPFSRAGSSALSGCWSEGSAGPRVAREQSLTVRFDPLLDRQQRPVVLACPGARPPRMCSFSTSSAPFVKSAVRAPLRNGVHVWPRSVGDLRLIDVNPFDEEGARRAVWARLHGALTGFPRPFCIKVRGALWSKRLIPRPSLGSPWASHFALRICHGQLQHRPASNPWTGHSRIEPSPSNTAIGAPTSFSGPSTLRA